jgi:methionyl-tRNA formyltransferase
MIRKEEGEIDWRKSAAEIERAVRAFHPWPTAYTHLRGKLLKIHRAEVGPHVEAPPATVVTAEPEAVAVATGRGTLRCLMLQLEGKRVMGARELVSGRVVGGGERLG